MELSNVNKAEEAGSEIDLAYRIIGLKNYNSTFLAAYGQYLIRLDAETGHILDMISISGIPLPIDEYHNEYKKYNAKMKQKPQEHDQSIEFITVCVCNPELNVVVVATNIKRLIVLQVEPKLKLLNCVFVPKRITAMTISVIRSKLVVADASGDVRLYDLKAFQPPSNIVFLGHTSTILDVEIAKMDVESESCEVILTADRDEHIRATYLDRPFEIICHYFEHKGPVSRLHIVKNGKCFLSGGQDPWLCLWDLASGNLIAKFDCFNGMATESILENQSKIGLLSHLHSFETSNNTVVLCSWEALPLIKIFSFENQTHQFNSLSSLKFDDDCIITEVTISNGPSTSSKEQTSTIKLLVAVARIHKDTKGNRMCTNSQIHSYKWENDQFIKESEDYAAISLEGFKVSPKIATQPIIFEIDREAPVDYFQKTETLST